MTTDFLFFEGRGDRPGERRRLEPTVLECVVACMAMVLSAMPAESQADEWRAAMERGNAEEQKGDYARAAASYREAVRTAEGFATGDRRRTHAWNALATMYDALGRLTDSESAYRRALAAAQQSGGNSDPDYAMVLGSLASLYMELGQPERSEEMIRQVLAAYALMERPDEVRLATARNILAEIVLATGKYREAGQLLSESVRILERHADAWNELALARDNLGVVRTRQKRFAEAEQLLRAALAAMESQMGPEHPMLLRVLNNLAGLQFQSGRREEAGDTLRRAMGIAERQLGEDHPVYGQLLHNYADYLRNTGEKAAGKTLRARAAKILSESRRSNGVGAVVDVSALRRK